jgi:hypothetical protein
MSNKWILGSTISTLMGILAAALYLVLVQPRQLGADAPNYDAEWLLWFFLAMVVASMLVNLSVLVAQPAQLLSRLSAFTSNTDKALLAQYQQQVQQFLQLHQQQLTRLSGESNIYVWTAQTQSVLVQIVTESKQQSGIEDMRLLFHSMLTHQCRQGFYVGMQRPDMQAEIFAKEAGIEILGWETLQNLHEISFTQKAC